jgi:hypothetical protein
MTPEEKRHQWRAILRVAPILGFGIPAILLSEHYLGSVGQWMVAVALLGGLLAYVRFLPKIPDE